MRACVRACVLLTVDAIARMRVHSLLFCEAVLIMLMTVILSRLAQCRDDTTAAALCGQSTAYKLLC